MARQILPDPQFSAAESGCLACGYDLGGLPGAGACPECGAPYGGDVVVLFGVPGTVSASPVWRRLVWIALILSGFAFFQLFPILLIAVPLGGYWVLVLAAIIIGGVVAMAASNRRERRGTERILFSEAGIRQTALKGHETKSSGDAFLPWGLANTLELRRISPFWRRLRIGYMTEHQRGMTLLFDAGVRCPDEVAQRVEETLHRMIAAHVAARRAGTTG